MIGNVSRVEVLRVLLSQGQAFAAQSVISIFEVVRKNRQRGRFGDVRCVRRARSMMSFVATVRGRSASGADSVEKDVRRGIDSATA